MLTMWASKDIGDGEEIYHSYGLQYWNLMDEIMATEVYNTHLKRGGVPLGQWWRKESSVTTWLRG